MSGGAPQGAAADSVSRDHPDVLSVCRWLPQPFPSGAFSGRHDVVHVGDRQAFVNLWLSEAPVHAGDYVGPPRGGLVPRHDADYDVVMPAGGSLNIRGGVLRGWAESDTGVRQVRADGEEYLSGVYGPARPYLVAHYRAMSRDDQLNALAAVRRRRLSVDGQPQPEGDDSPTPPVRLQQAEAIGEWVSSSRSPRTCTCRVDEPRGSGATSKHNRGVPGALLAQGGAIATMVGQASPEEACEVVWRLTRALTHPTQAGLMHAAEVAARRAAEQVSGWPDGPLTEDAVALVAAQALRWHGMSVAPRLPFWTLGWIFVARPIMDQLLPDPTHVGRERLRRAVLDRADRTRMQRVTHAWTAAHNAAQDLDSLRRLPPEAVVSSVEVIDLRESQDPLPDDLDGYRRTVESVIGELAAQ